MPTTGVKNRWQRLRSMGREELALRLGQQLRSRLDVFRYRSGFPIKPEPLLPVPPYTPKFFFAAEDVSRLCDLLRRRLPKQAEEIIARAERICLHRFDLLGYDDLYYGEDIDWHCDRVHDRRAPRKPWYKVRYLDFAEVGDSKVTWELNRHQHLVTLAKAYRLTGNEKFTEELFRQWQHWHAQNPYPFGINWASSLEVAFRSLSWIWVYFLLAGSRAMPAWFREEWLRALAVNGRHIEIHLSKYFSPNTHLLGEAVGLFFIGTLCPELSSAEHWRQRGWRTVVDEANRQVQPDGLHFEQSTYYHVYAVDFFLHAAMLALVNNTPVPAEFERSLEQMLDAICTLGRAGVPPQLGDDDGGRVFDPRRNRAEHMLDPLATGAVLFERGDFKRVSGGLREETIWLIGHQGVLEFDPLAEKLPAYDSVALEAGGLYALAGPSGEQLLIDAGHQGALSAGHGHADALSITLNCGGQMQLVDSGTCEYVGAGSERSRFRGTAAHNTLVVDGLPQADPGGPFGWINLPQVKSEAWISGRHFDLFIGSHDGYRRLPNPVLHRRWVFSLKADFWLVRDLALGQGQHRLDLHWHLSPHLVPGNEHPEAFFSLAGGSGLCVITAENETWARDVRREWFSPVYGRKEALNVLHFGTVAALPAEFVTLLRPLGDGRVPATTFRHLKTDAAAEVSGYHYEAADEEHTVFFASPGRAWSYGFWETDAEFLYWGRRRARHLLISWNGSFIKAAGHSLISCPRPTWCEVSIQDDAIEVSGSGADLLTDEQALRNLAVDREPAWTSPVAGPSQGR